jgi:hypothetical protein
MPRCVFTCAQDWSVPQRWFLHFYQWGSVVNLVALIALSANVGTSSSSSSSSMSPDTVRPVLAGLGWHPAAHVTRHDDAPSAARVVCRRTAACGAQVRALLLLALFQLHLLRRCAETGLLLHYPEDAQMHGIAYVFGLR